MVTIRLSITAAPRDLNLKLAAAKITASNPVSKDDGDPRTPRLHRRDGRAPLLKGGGPNQQRKGTGEVEENPEVLRTGEKTRTKTNTAPRPEPLRAARTRSEELPAHSLPRRTLEPVQVRARRALPDKDRTQASREE